MANLGHKMSNIELNWKNNNPFLVRYWFTNKNLAFGGVSHDLFHMLSLLIVLIQQIMNYTMLLTKK